MAWALGENERKETDKYDSEVEVSAGRINRTFTNS